MAFGPGGISTGPVSSAPASSSLISALPPAILPRVLNAPSTIITKPGTSLKLTDKPAQD